MRSQRTRNSLARGGFVAALALCLLLALATPALAKTPSVKTLAKYVTTLQKQVKALQSQNAVLAADDASNKGSSLPALQNQINSISGNPIFKLSPFVSVDPNAENGVNGPNLVFHGANVHVVSGSGSENDGGTLTGLGNLIVGYDDYGAVPAGQRLGSHNLIVGDDNYFQSYGSLVAGSNNSVGPNAHYASVSGGALNQATGQYASVSGGLGNEGGGAYSSVSGGWQNWIGSGGTYSSVSGGAGLTDNVAYSWYGGSSGTAYAGQFHSP